MAHFLSLEESKKYYAAVISLSDVYLRHLAINVHSIRYEDTILGFDEQLAGVKNFLGLEYEADMSDFYLKNRSRGQWHGRARLRQRLEP